MLIMMSLTQSWENHQDQSLHEHVMKIRMVLVQIKCLVFWTSWDRDSSLAKSMSKVVLSPPWKLAWLNQTDDILFSLLLAERPSASNSVDHRIQ